MTSLAIKKPSRAERTALLKKIAADLAPYLYRAECALVGMADSAAAYADLAAHQQQVYRDRAAVTVLGGLGFVSGKARDRAIYLAILDATAENGGAFAASAERLLESVAADAMRRSDGLLEDAWLELGR